MKCLVGHGSPIVQERKEKNRHLGNQGQQRTVVEVAGGHTEQGTEDGLHYARDLEEVPGDSDVGVGHPS